MYYSFRPFSVISRALQDYRVKYPTLYKEWLQTVNKGVIATYDFVTVSEEGYNEYLDLVQTHLKVSEFPDTVRRVIIQTHNGGEYVAFYEDGKWKYQTASEEILEVSGSVIHWEEYDNVCVNS